MLLQMQLSDVYMSSLLTQRLSQEKHKRVSVKLFLTLPLVILNCGYSVVINTLACHTCQYCQPYSTALARIYNLPGNIQCTSNKIVDSMHNWGHVFTCKCCEVIRATVNIYYHAVFGWRRMRCNDWSSGEVACNELIACVGVSGALYLSLPVYPNLDRKSASALNCLLGHALSTSIVVISSEE